MKLLSYQEFTKMLSSQLENMELRYRGMLALAISKMHSKR